MYYLQSRYYDPVIGRFINADEYASTGQGFLGNNMFVYCLNNPVNMVDISGCMPQWMEKGMGWLEENVLQPCKDFWKGIAKDVANYDKDNQSEAVVLESNYFSSYKGILVFRINGDRSGSFGAIFLTRETNERENPEDMVRHEYGHSMQFKEIGMVKYTICILLPSWQMWGSGEYYCKPWEVTADLYGKVFSRTHSNSEILAGFEYLDASKHIGPLVLLSIE